MLIFYGICAILLLIYLEPYGLEFIWPADFMVLRDYIFFFFVLPCPESPGGQL